MTDGGQVSRDVDARGNGGADRPPENESRGPGSREGAFTQHRAEFARRQKAYQRDLAVRADRHMDTLEALPAGKRTLERGLTDGGVSRRDFLKWVAIMTATLGLPSAFEPRVARAATLAPRLPVVWIELQSCTGNSEALIKNTNPGIDRLVLELLSVEYMDVLMAAAGDQAESTLDEAIRRYRGQFIAVFEGSVPVGEHAHYLTIGAKGETGEALVRRVAREAKVVLSAGSCAAFGNIPAARPNPTSALGVKALLERSGIRTPVINLPACPVNSINVVGTILEYVMFGRIPNLDALSRPTWAYGTRIHDKCERRGNFDAGEFVEGWDDTEGLKRGYCLYKVGCKGPFTYNNCGVVRYNQGASWPIMSGHGCIGCSEPEFWDALSPFEEPVAGYRYRVPGSTDATADTIGKVALAAVGIGIAAHGAATALRAAREPGEPGAAPGTRHSAERSAHRTEPVVRDVTDVGAPPRSTSREE